MSVKAMSMMGGCEGVYFVLDVKLIDRCCQQLLSEDLVGSRLQY